MDDNGKIVDIYWHTDRDESKLYYIMPGYHHGHNYGQCYINLYYIMYHNVISQLLVIVGYIPTIGVITVITMDIATPWP